MAAVAAQAAPVAQPEGGCGAGAGAPGAGAGADAGRLDNVLAATMANPLAAAAFAAALGAAAGGASRHVAAAMAAAAARTAEPGFAIVSVPEEVAVSQRSQQRWRSTGWLRMLVARRFAAWGKLRRLFGMLLRPG